MAAVPPKQDRAAADEHRKKRTRAALVLLFGSLSILASITRLHGIPALLSGVAGGVLIAVGIVLVAKAKK